MARPLSCLADRVKSSASQHVLAEYDLPMKMASIPIANQRSSRVGEDVKQNSQFRREFRRDMVFEWYGLLENPFGVTPDSRYLYLSSTHAEARSSLIVGVEFGLGFQALIAPPGTGKTTILFDVLERFNNVARTAFLFQIHGDSHDLLRSLILELEGESHDPDLMQMQDAINQLLIREHRAGRRTIIIIDEAQNLDASVLETIRLLSNFETPNEKLAQVILAGQPRLAQKLANPKLTQLRQRISHSFVHSFHCSRRKRGTTLSTD